MLIIPLTQEKKHTQGISETKLVEKSGSQGNNKINNTMLMKHKIRVKMNKQN